jgi:hypothetical protein
MSELLSDFEIFGVTYGNSDTHLYFMGNQEQLTEERCMTATCPPSLYMIGHGFKIVAVDTWVLHGRTYAFVK